MFLPDIPTGPSGVEECLLAWFQQFLSRPPTAGVFEVEAKLGRFVDKNSGGRISLPVHSETILDESSLWFRFESDIPVALHRHFNGLLNKEVSKGRLTYKHVRTVDNIYRGDAPKSKCRVTVDEKGNYVECIEKRRVADMAIFFPNAPFDVRISINEEVPMMRPTGSPFMDRRKDRMSYVLAADDSTSLQVDLTQVRQSGEATPRHELEMEFINPKNLASSAKSVSAFYAAIRNVVRATAI